MKFLTESYKPILREQKTICLHNPLDNPLKRARKPSSLHIVFIVPNNPVYLVVYCTPDNCKRTFAVSNGIVNTSAVHPAKPLSFYKCIRCHHLHPQWQVRISYRTFSHLSLINLIIRFSAFIIKFSSF